MRLERFGLYARDPEALAKWYEKSVGVRVIRCLEREGRPPVYFLASAGDAEIEILPTEEPRVEGDQTVRNKPRTTPGVWSSTSRTAGAASSRAPSRRRNHSIRVTP